MPLVVFTGGARSGKSGAAQQLAHGRMLDGASVVTAVFGQDDGDVEFAERVVQHRRHRPAEFTVIEATDSYTWMAGVPAQSLLLLDCLGTLLGLVMAEEWARCQTAVGFTDAGDSLPVGYSAAVEARAGEVVSWLVARSADTIVVTNEVGDGVVPAYATGRLFRDVVGRANRTLVARADSAYLCVAGRLIDLSLAPTSAHWPQD